MTATLARPSEQNLWSTMPGWGIVADLTPPEVIAARRLHLLRKLIVAGLVLVVLLCAGGYVLAVRQHSSASDALNGTTARTTQLQAQVNKYGGVTRIQGTVDGVRSRVATLMQGDVDLTTLLVKIRTALPASMSIKQLGVTLNPTTGAPAAATPGLNLSGHSIIGTVTLSGSGRTLDDLPAYVDALAALKGVVNLVPTSNQTGTGGTQFAMTFALTDQLYSHRYDMSNTGGK
ncbi:MAG: hypothetical protein ACRDWT_11620 [Jatrophihabitantaceae bacterium]